MNIPEAPGANASRLFGVSALNTAAYIRFSIDDALTCQTSDGITTTESSSLSWNSDWTGASIVFRIRWESGNVKFFINNTQVYTVNDDSIPSGPLSLYLYDDATSAMTIGDINVRGTQSFVMNLKTSDLTSFSGVLNTTTKVTVSENISIFIKVWMIYPTETVTVSENIALTIV